MLNWAFTAHMFNKDLLITLRLIITSQRTTEPTIRLVRPRRIRSACASTHPSTAYWLSNEEYLHFRFKTLGETYIKKKKKSKRKVQGVPQSQNAALPDPKRKRKPTNPNKHKSNKRTKSTKISSLFPKRGNRNTKRTEKHKNKMTHKSCVVHSFMNVMDHAKWRDVKTTDAFGDWIERCYCCDDVAALKLSKYYPPDLMQPVMWISLQVTREK